MFLTKVVLFLVVGLGAVEGHRRHGTHHLRQLVLTPRKGGVVELGAPARQGLEGIAGILHRLCIGAMDDFHRTGPFFPDTGELVAGDHGALRVDDAHGPVCAVLHLEHNALKNPAGHRSASSSAPRRHNIQSQILLYRVFSPFSIGYPYFFVENAETKFRSSKQRSIPPANAPFRHPQGPDLLRG